MVNIHVLEEEKVGVIADSFEASLISSSRIVLKRSPAAASLRNVIVHPWIVYQHGNPSLVTAESLENRENTKPIVHLLNVHLESALSIFVIPWSWCCDREPNCDPFC